MSCLSVLRAVERGTLATACGRVLVAVFMGLASAGWAESARDLGANGSDESDDTIAIQAALDAVAEHGGEVRLPAGKYYLSRPLVIAKDAVSLVGEGRGGPSPRSNPGTTLVLRSENAATAVVLRNCAYSGVRNLTISREKAIEADGSDAFCRRARDPVGAQLAAPSRADQGPPLRKGNGSEMSHDQADPAHRGQAAIVLEGTYHAFVKEVLLAETMCGIEILNGISPVLEDVDVKNPAGDYGIWLHGSGGARPGYRKVDAALFYRVTGGTKGNTRVEWVVIGPNVDGAEVQDGRFVGGSRALVLRGGDPARGDQRPKYVYTSKFGCDHVENEGVLVEAGNDLFMVNTWIGQNKHATGFVIGKNFTGGALLTNLRIRGSGGHGLHVRGGRNIYIVNPLIGACATDRDLHPAGAADGCGILIDRGVRHLRVNGGGVGELFETGPRARQHFGIRYLGTDQEAAADSIHISGVDTDGNPVGHAPAALLAP